MTPILQAASSECGLACLAMISNHHGKQIDLPDLRSRFALSLRGMNLAAMVQVATSLGFASRPLRVKIDQIGRLACPCVLHWDMNHFVVLVGVGRQSVTLYDPANGEVCMSRKELARHFTGIALELTPTCEFEKEEKKPRAKWSELVGKTIGLKRGLFQLILLAGALQVLGLVSPLGMQWVMDGAIVSGDHDLLSMLIMGISLLMFIELGLSCARSLCSLALTTQINIQWSNRLISHLLRLPASYFETRHIGDISSRFNSINNIQHTVTGVMIESLLDGVFSIVVLIMLLVYSPLLSLIIFVALSIYAVIRCSSYGYFKRVSGEYITLSARAQTHFIESIRGYQSIKIGLLADLRRTRWINLLVDATNRQLTTSKLSMVFDVCYTLLFGLEKILVLGIGAKMVMNNTFSVGMLMAFIAYKDQFSGRMRSLIDKWISFKLLDLDIERLSDIVLTPVEETEGSRPMITEDEAPSTFQPLSKGIAIEIEKLGFRYGDGEKWVLRNLDLRIEPGEHVAIVGASGCGKSTLVKLILGLLEPDEGAVLIDGTPLKQYGLANWRRCLGVVMQDDQLFSGSIFDNISSFDEKPDRARIEAAARLASVHEEIVSMPMGYKTLAGDMGSSLSGGQKQRVLLARAFYKNPKVLVLDEATSHLDVTTERSVGHAVSKLGVTRIVIAHRPETIAMADRVIDIRALLAADEKAAA